MQLSAKKQYACIFFLGRQPHRVQCQSLCGSELNTLKWSGGGHVSQCHIAGDANGPVAAVSGGSRGGQGAMPTKLLTV